MKPNLKKILPHIIAVVIFILLATAYLSPVLQNKELPQMDQIHAVGVSHELNTFTEETGEVSMWTNSLFSGMPAYQIKGGPTKNVFAYISTIARLSLPYFNIGIVFVSLLGFYILLCSLNLNHWLSIGGAVAYAFASYNMIILEAGHITKLYAIGFMPAVLGGIILIYNQKKYLWGGILLLFSLGIEVYYNHLQINYYLMLIILIFVITQFIFAIREKDTKHFITSSAIAVFAAILAVIPFSTTLMTTYEYGQESIRGASELTPKEGEKKSSGLDKDYALAWSYGIDETFTLFIPNAKGGGSGYIGSTPKALKKIDPRFQEAVSQQNHYWGDQPFTSGPVYLGAIICFLFLLGMVFIEGRNKWWILAATLLSILLAWGRNFEGFTDLFFYNFPLYNKFRVVAMALVMTGVTIPLMAMLALKEILTKPEKFRGEIKTFYYVTGFATLFLLMLAIKPTAFLDFLSNQEEMAFAKQQSQYPQSAAQIAVFTQELVKARIAIFRPDVFRSLAFILLAAGFIWLFITDKLKKKQYVIAALVALMFFDVWTVAKRYLNNNDFVTKQKAKNSFAPTQADKDILQDKDPNFRVFNLTRSPFNDAYTSYFHKSIGGYHGAKLRRYQELIDHHISKNNTKVLNMLNTKYIIGKDKKGQPVAQLNPQALGNAWFVKDFKIVENADKEIAALTNFAPKKTAVIDKRFNEEIAKLPKITEIDSIPSLIKLTKYKPNELTYEVNALRNEFAVFSEVYYDKGWNAYLDGKLENHVRVNYVLRGMNIPKGKHTLVFKFEPKTYHTAQTVSLIGSILVILVLGGAVFVGLKRDRKKED